ncbi:MAG: hypothetical protein GY805_30975, partial [Chloroflexi bacterium]|nr:hypothetical protein [Chloroflexota bacterium]
EAYNELDIELYRFAQSLFAEKMRRYGPAFDRDLRVFTSLNRLYGRLAPVSRKVNRTVRLLKKA